MTHHQLHTTIVALLLFAITLTSWIFFDLGGSRALSASVVSIILITLTLVKSRLILLHFMELKRAPFALKAIFDAWLIVVGGLIMIMVG